MDVLTLNDVSISYQSEKEAVRHVSLTVPEKQILAIVGESGSGKSTILRAMMHLLPAGGAITGGTIAFCGKNMREYNAEEVRRMRGTEISMIFQDAGAYLNPRRRIGSQYMEMLGSHLTISKKEKHNLAIRMLTNVQLPDPERIMKSYPFQLSGGMRQRVGIAMAMSMQPKLLLADEPTSALDVTVQAQVVQEMLNLRDKYGTAIVIVTHNMGVAAKMADYIAVMRQGELVEYGTRDQVILNPQQEYTKHLLSVVPELERKEHEKS